MKAHLTLITHTTHHTPHRARDAAQELYDHWRQVMPNGDLHARVLSAERRALLERWLALFDPAVLELAQIGCAGSAWCGGRNQSGRVFHHLEFIYESEARIEALAKEGRRALQSIERRAAPAEPLPAADAADPAEKEAARARLAELREQLARRAGR